MFSKPQQDSSNVPNVNQINVQKENDQLTQFPKNDIFHQYQSDSEDSNSKFDYLKAKFPHTFTSMKWGFTLGAIFGLHTYIKTRNVGNSIYWFVWGSILTGLPIWGFFMFKYSFYTMTLRKFEIEQYQQVEDSNIIKEFMIKKAGIKNITGVTDEQLVKKVEVKQQKFYQKESQLDSILDDVDEDEFELLPKQFRIQWQQQDIQQQQQQ